MTTEQAGEIVATLVAVFYRETLERPTVAWWTHQISKLENYDAAYSVANGFGYNAERFPTFPEFKQAYQAEVERLTPVREAIEEVAESTRGIPDWVLVWTWMRHNGDFRTLPQQEGWEMATSRVERDQYQQAVNKWRAAGSPREAMPTL